MIITSAQIKVEIGDIVGNLQKHLKMIDLASEQYAKLIVFPEMSLTGYCREEAATLAFSLQDNRLEVLKAKADKYQITIIVGAPVIIEDQLYIGSFIILPKQIVKVYTKQFLHKGEEVFFKASFNYNPIIRIKDERISLAICADINTETHAVNACKENTTLYIASIFFSEEGIEKGLQKLGYYGKRYGFAVLMANYSGTHWQIKAGGNSAFWSEHGEFKSKLTVIEEGLLIAIKEDKGWFTKSITI